MQHMDSLVEALDRGEPVDLGSLPPPPGEFSGNAVTGGSCDVQCTKCSVLSEHSDANKLSVM